MQKTLKSTARLFFVSFVCFAYFSLVLLDALVKIALPPVEQAFRKVAGTGPATQTPVTQATTRAATSPLVPSIPVTQVPPVPAETPEKVVLRNEFAKTLIDQFSVDKGTAVTVSKKVPVTDTDTLQTLVDREVKNYGRGFYS